MPNALHKSFTLDNNHALNARTYADIAARDADAAFNTDATNINKSARIESPLSFYMLTGVGPAQWIELTNVTAGDVTTSDDLLVTQLLLGNGGKDLVTEPDLTYSANLLNIDGSVNITAANSLSFGGSNVISEAGGITLENIDALDATTETTIETAIDTLPNLASVGTISGSIIGPSGAWDDGGMNLGPEDSYAIDGVDVIDEVAGTITLENIAALDATTQATILGISGNVTSGDVLAANQLLLGNGGTDIVTEPDLVWDGAMFGVGIANPVSRAHFFENSVFSGPSAGVTIEQAGTGDVMLQFLLAGGMRWITGIDNSDGDKFKINDAVNFSTDGAITIQPSTEYVGFGTNAADTRVDVSDVGGDAIRLRSGNASGSALNQVKMSLDSGLQFTHAVKTRHNEFNQFGNAIDIFLWDADTDDPADVGTLPVLTIRGDGRIGVSNTAPSSAVDIISLFGDTTPVIEIASSSNAGVARFRVGDRDPNGMVNGIGPDLYFRDDGVLSAVYENRNATSSNTWLRHSVYPTDIIEITSSAELDDLASGGVITISSNTTLVIKAPITTANRFNVTGAFTFFHITGEYSATASITYTGTGTFITSVSLVRLFAQVQLISSSTGTFMDVNGGGGVNLREIALIGWDDLGTVVNTGFFASETFFQNIGSGFTLTNNFITTVSTLVLAGTDLNGPFFTVNTNNPFSLYSFTDVSAFALGATGSLLDLDTRINNDAGVTVTRSAISVGNLFRPSVLTDATINSVADGSPATGTITAMADNGSGGTTISSTTTYFEDEEVTITGTTSYNGTFQIFNVVAGVSFDTITAFVADDATGSVDSTRLTLSLAGGHGISTGDSIKIIDTNFYNGFETTLNVVTNDITVNGVFVSTNTGSIERDLSLDHSDPRVSAQDNKGFADSHDIACAHVNDNGTATGAITNNVFTDMVFGTAGTALIASSTMERWKLVDELNGTFEFIGNEIFDGSITFDFTVVSAGGTVEFRFKWLIDTGSGFVDLTDNVEALVAVGSSAQSTTKTYPLAAAKGDRIKPQITRNSGSSSITSTYVTMYVSQVR